MRPKALPVSPHVIAHRERAVGALVVHGRQGQLLQVVGALGTAGRLAGRLDGGQEQRDQDGDDRDDDEQLDQGETGSSVSLPTTYPS